LEVFHQKDDDVELDEKAGVGLFASAQLLVATAAEERMTDEEEQH
jgi:hypothetical protein